MSPILRIAAVLALLTGVAHAQQKELTVAGYAGSLETSLRAELIRLFEKTHGVRVDYRAGNSAETLGQVRFSGKGIDVAIADDRAIAEAIEGGLCNRIDGLTADSLQPAARFKDDRAVALGLAGTGFATRFFKEKGWTPPASWNDLKDPKYRKLLVVPPIDTGYGLAALVMLARANGGDEKNIEPGFKALKEGVGPNVLAYEPSAVRISELFHDGQARLIVWGSGRAQYFANVGQPMGFVYPKEGTPIATAAACPTALPQGNALASEFIKALLQPGMQRLFFRDYGYAPAVKNVELPAERAAIAPVGERAAKLITLDWDTINAHREEWTARWKREIAK